MPFEKIQTVPHKRSKIFYLPAFTFEVMTINSMHYLCIKSFLYTQIYQNLERAICYSNAKILLVKGNILMPLTNGNHKIISITDQKFEMQEETMIVKDKLSCQQ